MNSQFRGSLDLPRRFDLRDKPMHIGTGTEMRLIIVAPMHMPDAIIRPFNYNIGYDFISEIRSNMDLMRKDVIGRGGFGKQDAAVRHPLGEVPNDLILNAVPYRFGRREINYYYRFILILKNSPYVTRISSRPGRNQITYNGFFLDEPISNSGELNPEAEMIFTHVTHMNIKDKIGALGYDTYVETQLNCDVLPPLTKQLDSNSSSDRDYLISPDAILDSYHPGDLDDFESVSSSRYTTLSQFQSAPIQHSMHNNPRQQLSRIAAAAIEAAISQNSDTFIAGRHIDPAIGEYVRTSDKYLSRRLFRTRLNTAPDPHVAGPQYHKKLTLGNLIADYPMVRDNAIVIQADSTHFDCLNEENNDLMVMCSAYLKVATPAVFSDFGFSEVSLRYASSDPRQTFVLRQNRECIWEVMSATPYIEEPMEHTRLRMQKALDCYKETALRVIEEIAGEIELLMQYKANDITVIQLQLREQTDVINNDYVIQHGDLGGLISPAIGGIDDFEHGEQAIEDIVEAIDGNNQFTRIAAATEAYPLDKPPYERDRYGYPGEDERY